MYIEWFYGVVVSTLDFESSDLGSTPGRTSFLVVFLFDVGFFNNYTLRYPVHNKKIYQKPFILVNYRVRNYMKQSLESSSYFKYQHNKKNSNIEHSNSSPSLYILNKWNHIKRRIFRHL